MQLFLAVAEAGSFSEAALRLGVGQATISRRIALLEERLGQPLFHRGRRGTSLTELGAHILPAAQQMARWAAELERSVQAHQSHEIEGVVRLASPPGTGYDLLIPFGEAIKASHPKLRLELLASIEYLDLARGEADLAIRLKPPTDPALYCAASISVPVRPFASVSYLETLPKAPTLQQVAWISWAGARRDLSPRPELEALIERFEPSFASDDYLLQRRACELGLGALLLPAIKHPLLDYRGLQPFHVQGLPSLESTMYLVCAHSAQHIPRVRAVIQAITEILDQLKTYPAPLHTDAP